MILYFCDRSFNVIDKASSSLPGGFQIIDDNRISELETGVKSLEFTIQFNKSDRSWIEKMCEEGNFLLTHNKSGIDECYTIIETELDTAEREIEVYAEDAGLDMLNHVVPKFPDIEMGDDDRESFSASIDWYLNKWLYDSGFQVGINEIDTTIKKRLTADESTLTERILAIAELFGAEIGFSFEIREMVVVGKYLNIYQKRGSETEKILRLGKEIKNISVTTSIADVATALQVVGGNNAAGIPVTLDGYTYDDGDFYLADRTDYPSTAKKKKLLYSREARHRWSRYRFDAEPGKLVNGTGDILKVFRSSLTNQKALLDAAIAELKVKREPAKNFKCDFYYLPNEIQLGDTVTIVDDEGDLFLSARVLKIEESEYDDSRSATLGNYLIKQSDISEEVSRLAAQFEQFADRTLYTWVVYADDENGTGISLNPKNKLFVGISNGHPTEEPDLHDPSIYTFAVYQKAKHYDVIIEDVEAIKPDSKCIFGSYTCKILENGAELDNDDLEDRAGYIEWHLEDKYGTLLKTGRDYTIPEDTYASDTVFVCVYHAPGTMVFNSILVKVNREIYKQTKFYKVQARSLEPPKKPISDRAEGWTTTLPEEPPSDDSNTIAYETVLTEYDNSTWEYSDVVISSDFDDSHIAKQAAEDVKTLEGRVADLQDQIDTLERTLTTSLSGIRRRQTALEESVASLEERVEDLEQRVPE